MKRAIFCAVMLATTAWADAPAETTTSAAPAAPDASRLEAAPSAEGYFNHGLAREKAGDVVDAMLAYQRALVLDPGLLAARNALSKLSAAKGVPQAPRTWLDDVTTVAHPDLLLTFGGLVAWLGLFGVFAAAASRHRAGYTALALLALVLGGGAAATGWLADARLSVVRPAIVSAAGGAEVLSSPANNSTVVVALPAGSPVGVVSPRGAWTYIDLAGGARGWVQTDRLTLVIPGESL